MRLPTGTVTFLFTDIEGSTKLWQRYPAAMISALARHHDILQQAILASRGYVFQIVGDAFYAAFHTASDALNAALDAQRALQVEAWDEIEPLRVRMAIHTGAIEVRVGEYTSGEYVSGMTLNWAARLLSAGHGGQVLLSQPARDLLAYDLPDQVYLRDLGEHRLRDMRQAVRVFQVVCPDLPDHFPALKSLDVIPNNLPLQLTSFVGRQAEIELVCGYLRRDDVRLLTLLGPGGVGKTRLSLQVAMELLHDFRDGVYFISLAPIQKSELVATTIAQELGVRGTADCPISEALKEELREKRMLFVLDNFEHVLPAGLFVAELLISAPGLKILATSRAALHLRGEYEFAVPTLSLPDKDVANMRGGELVAALSRNEAVRLFTERAEAVKADFSLTCESALAVAEICRRVDGLPLAIELAAARVKHLPPKALLERLGSRLQVLTGGARDLPARQQTLRNTLEWSYELLDEAERILFNRLGVFAGGCTLEVAEAVCGTDGHFDVLDGLASLVDKNLVRQEQGLIGEPRYTMLETIREYAMEKLRASGEETIIRRKHLRTYNAMAETGESRFIGPEEETWLKRFQEEYDNMRAALIWVLESNQAEESDVEAAAWLAGRYWQYWYSRGDLSEGRRWISLTLNKVTGRMPARAKVLIAAGCLSWQQGDYTDAAPLLEESVEILRSTNNERDLAEALHILAHLVFDLKQYTRARELFQESHVLYQKLGNVLDDIPLIGDLGMVAYHLGDYETARAQYKFCLDASRAHGSRENLSQSLIRLGDLARLASDYEEATGFYEEAMTYFKQIEMKLGYASGLHKLGYLALASRDTAKAGALFRESLNIQYEAGNKQGIAEDLFGLAGVAVMEGQAERAVHLFGAAQALLDAVGAPLAPADQVDVERDLAHVRAVLVPRTFDTAWRAGMAMPLEQTVRYALLD